MRKFFLALLALLVVFGMVVGGCAKSEPASSASDSSPSPTGESPKEETKAPPYTPAEWLDKLNEVYAKTENELKDVEKYLDDNLVKCRNEHKQFDEKGDSTSLCQAVKEGTNRFVSIYDERITAIEDLKNRIPNEVQGVDRENLTRALDELLDLTKKSKEGYASYNWLGLSSPESPRSEAYDKQKAYENNHRAVKAIYDEYVYIRDSFRPLVNDIFKTLVEGKEFTHTPYRGEKYYGELEALLNEKPE